MNRTVPRAVALILALSATYAVSQTTSPVAYIYVSSSYDGPHDYRVVGFAANANGELTEIPGSPWADNVNYMAANGSYLFGSTNIQSDNGRNIFSYHIESNGALKYIGANNIQNPGSQNACNQAENLLLDHTGSYLYVFVQNADCNSEVAYQSFAVNKSTGLLEYLGVTEPNAITPGSPLTMLADNEYAYASGYRTDGSEICGFKKASNGNLVDLDSSNESPVCNTAWPGTEGQPSGTDAHIAFLAADPTNHLAVDMQYFYNTSGYLGDEIGNIAINTANGSQSTSSTYANMPSTDTPADPVNTIAMAPGGKLLAVGSASGIQIFNFNPNGQASANTSLIATDPITEMYWDTSNHLYAIGTGNNTLHVFTVTATSVIEAPGSPYFVTVPEHITGHSVSASPVPGAQYVASFGPSSNAKIGSGTVSVDPSGNVTVQLSGAPTNQSYTLEFCPAVLATDQNSPACFNVGAVSTSSTGTANATMSFPKSGSWAGDFQLNSGSRPEYFSSYTPAFLAQLQPESTVNEGALKVSGDTQLPLTSGRVTYSDDSFPGNDFEFNLIGTGVSGPSGFEAIETETPYMDGSGSYVISGPYAYGGLDGITFFDAPSSEGGDLLEVELSSNSSNQQGFIGGFSIP
jgi:6-phosphogluconolactonase (cycloisomerase 2 family)